MSTNETSEAAAAAKDPLSDANYKSYGDIVWEQFRKYRLSYVSLWGVLGLFMLAIYAPVISLNVPFYIHVPEGTQGVPEALHGTSFPWFKALFDMNFFEVGVDIFFNFLVFAVPAAALIWLGIRGGVRARTKRPEYQRFRTRYMLISGAVFVLGFAALYFYGFRQPYFDYASIAEMEGVRAVFPLFEYSYRDVDLMAVNEGISLGGGDKKIHILGTDNQGRDVFTRLLYGTRISLTIGILAVAIYTFIGIVLGSLGGYFGGRVDMVVLRLIEVMLCFPTFFLILTLRGFVENASVFHIMLIIGLTGWTGIARLVRGEFLRLRKQDFVQAAIALGYDRPRIIFRHVMPNALGPVLVSATFGVAGAIILEASLSFLGLGPVTAPSWGQIMTDGRRASADTFWVLVLSSGFAIFVTVSLLNLVGEGVRDALDPKMRR